jgi:hypothetical protein
VGFRTHIQPRENQKVNHYAYFEMFTSNLGKYENEHTTTPLSNLSGAVKATTQQFVLCGERRGAE